MREPSHSALWGGVTCVATFAYRLGRNAAFSAAASRLSGVARDGARSSSKRLDVVGPHAGHLFTKETIQRIVFVATDRCRSDTWLALDATVRRLAAERSAHVPAVGKCMLCARQACERSRMLRHLRRVLRGG